MKKTFKESISPTMEGFIIGFIIILILESLIYFIYFYANEAQKGEIFEGLRRTSNTVKTLVDIEKHKHWTDAKQEIEPAFQWELSKLRNVIDSDSTIEYIYTVIHPEKNRYLFVLDPTPPEHTNKLGVLDKSYLMDQYKEPCKELKACFDTGKSTITHEVYYDEWGGHISCFVPLSFRNGKTEAILGLDIEAQTYLARLKPLQEATLRAMLAAFFIGYLVGISTWLIRAYQRSIIYVK